MKRLILALTMLAAVPSLVPAQDVVVVRAARFLDVARGEYVPNAVVVIENGRIRDVNPAAPPTGARTIDLGSMTLLPGLIDAHTHLAYDIEGDWPHAPVTQTAADLAMRAVRNGRRTVEAGFTTIREVGSGYFIDVAIGDAVQRGWIVAPRVIGAGHSLGITGGHCDRTGFIPGVLEVGPEQGVADGVDGMLRAARYQIKHGAKVIKVCATAGVLSFEESVGAQQMTDEELRAVVEEAARHGMKVAAHAHGTEGILAAVRAGVASIEHGSMIDDEAMRLMRERGTYLVPTTYLAERIDLSVLPPPIRAKAEWIVPRAVENLTRAIRAGVPIAFGTDAGVYPHGENAKELGVLVRRGMTPIQAIRAATLNAADLLGVEDRAEIAPGKFADLIAVEGDPLQDVTVLESVRFVMLGGQVVKGP